MYRLGFVVLAIMYLILIAGELRAADPTPLPTIIAPQGKKVNSDYGPRDAALSYATKYHRGIDYNYAFGEKVPLLESGKINTINRDSIGRWIITVKNIERDEILDLRYLHLFVNENLPIHIKSGDEYWSLILKQTINGQKRFIIRWTNPYYLGTRAQYIIGEESGVKIACSEVAFHHYYIWDSNQHKSVAVDFTVTPTLTPDPSATPTPTPSQYIVNEDSSGELESLMSINLNNVPYIGPAGDSGTLDNNDKTHPHLHIDFANQLINPFYYMHHFDESNPDCKNENADFEIKLTGPRNNSDEQMEKENGYWIETNKPESAFLRAEINSYKRKDLDRVVIYLTGINKNGNDISKEKIREFYFKGSPDSLNVNDVINSYTQNGQNIYMFGIGNGVNGLPVSDGTCGLEHFGFDWFNSTENIVKLTDLDPNSQHKLIIEASSIGGADPIYTNAKEYTFNIAPSKPLVKIKVKQGNGTVLDQGWQENDGKIELIGDGVGYFNTSETMSVAFIFTHTVDQGPEKPKLLIKQENGQVVGSSQGALLINLNALGRSANPSEKKLYAEMKKELFGSVTDDQVPANTYFTKLAPSTFEQLAESSRIQFIAIAKYEDWKPENKNKPSYPKEYTTFDWAVKDSIKPDIQSPLTILAANRDLPLNNHIYTLGARRYDLDLIISEKNISDTKPEVQFYENQNGTSAPLRTSILQLQRTEGENNSIWRGAVDFAGLPNGQQIRRLAVEYQDAAGNSPATTYIDPNTITIQDVSAQVNPAWIESEKLDVTQGAGGVVLAKLNFSPPYEIMKIGFGSNLGVFDAVVAMKMGASTVKDWRFKYDSDRGALVNSAGNTVSVENAIVKDDAGEKKVFFSWDGIGEMGSHERGPGTVEIEVIDSGGNKTTDNSLAFEINDDQVNVFPNDPTRNQINAARAAGSYSNRTVIIPGLFSLGGLEFSGLTDLFGQFNVDFRPANLFGDMKWGNIDQQVDLLRRQIEAYATNETDKLTLVAWGQAGILAKKYLMDHAPIDKIAKLVTVSTPIRGINSLPMATQSYAITLLFQPVVSLLADLGLDKILSDAQEAMGPYGPDLSFLNFLTKTSRNDLVINPMNVIGLLMGRFDYARNFQADSDLMKDLNAWNSKDAGIPTASVTTALWPDMDGLVQGAIVAGFAALGFAGAYSQVVLFDVRSKTYNNLNEEAAELLTSLLEQQMERLIFNPLKEKLNETLRQAEEQFLYSLWHDYAQDGFQTKISELLAQNPGWSLEKAGQEVLRDFIYDKLGLDPTKAGDLLKKPLQQVRDQLNQGFINDLKIFIAHPLVGEIGNKAAGILGEQGKSQLENTLSNYLGQWVPINELDNLFAGLMAQVDGIIAVVKADVDREIDGIQLAGVSEADQLLGNLTPEAERIFIGTEDFRRIPFEMINAQVDSLLKQTIQAPIRKELKKYIASVLPDLNKLLQAIPALRVTCPGGITGAAIIGGLAYLGTDFLKNTDGISEVKPLATSILFGLKASQAEPGGQQKMVKGWHWSGAQSQADIAAMIATAEPKILAIQLNGKPMYEHQVGPRDLPGKGLYFLDAENQMREMGKVGMTEFFKGMRGKILDNNPQFCTLRVAFNYEPYWEAPLTQDGVFQLYSTKERTINLLDGVNTVVMEAENKYGGKSRQVFQIILDMMGIQIAPIYPWYEEYIRETMPNIRAVVYNTDIDPDAAAISYEMKLIDFDRNTPVAGSALRVEDNEKMYITPGHALEQGYYALDIQAADSSGNKSRAAWGFYVDLSAPAADLQLDEPAVYSWRKDPIWSARYLLSDNLSPLLNKTRFRILTANGLGVIYDSGETATRAVGADVFKWDYKPANSQTRVADGTYQFEMSTQDLAGNLTKTAKSFEVDSQVPSLHSVVLLKSAWPRETMTDKVINNDFANFQVEYQLLSEDAAVRVEMTNTLNGRKYQSAQQGYYRLREIIGLDDQGDPVYGEEKAENIFTWDLGNPFMDLEDGIYTLSLMPTDAAGNSGSAYIINDLIVDRTPPAVYDLYAQPFVMTGGLGVKLYCKADEKYDISAFQGQPMTFKISAVEMAGGLTAKTYAPVTAAAAPMANLVLEWDGISEVTGQPVNLGKYAFRVEVADQRQSRTIRFTDFIKDGVAPEIAYPDSSGATLTGTVTLKGTAVDPLWNNREPFANYQLYYKQGTDNSPPVTWQEFDAQGWRSALIEVPGINRQSETKKHVSLRPVQNNAVLGYWHTQSLVQNAPYTLLLLACEQGVGQERGAFLADTARAWVNNDLITNPPPGKPPLPNPQISLAFMDLPQTVSFDGGNTLNVEYALSLQDVPSADVSLQILGSADETVLFERQAGINGIPLDAKPSIGINSSDAAAGCYIWQDGQGIHLRINGGGNTAPARRFCGDIKTDGYFKEVMEQFESDRAEGLTYSSPEQISFECFANLTVTSEAGLDVLDLETTGTHVTFDLYMNGSALPASHVWVPSPNAAVSDGRVVLPLNQPRERFIWDGRDHYGALAPDGVYTLLLTGIGSNNAGYGSASVTITVQSALYLADDQLSTAAFSPYGDSELNSTTLQFNLSKNARVDINIIDSLGATVCVLAQDRICEGGSGWLHRFAWKGNGPETDSMQLLPVGHYSVELLARAAENQANSLSAYYPVEIISPNNGTLSVTLDQIGQPNGTYEGLDVIQGQSNFNMEIEGIGRWFPPLPIDFKLHAKGVQTVIQYPYVPFVTKARKHYEGLMAQLNSPVNRPDYSDPDNGTAEETLLYNHTAYRRHYLDLKDLSVRPFSSWDQDQNTIEKYVSAPAWVYTPPFGQPVTIPAKDAIFTFTKSAIDGDYFDDEFKAEKEVDNSPVKRWVDIQKGKYLFEIYAPHDPDIRFSNLFFAVKQNDWGGHNFLDDTDNFEVNLPAQGKIIHDYSGCDNARLQLHGYLRYKNWDPGFGRNNLVNRFAQWASENRYYFGGNSDGQAIEPITQDASDAGDPPEGYTQKAKYDGVKKYRVNGFPGLEIISPSAFQYVNYWNVTRNAFDDPGEQWNTYLRFAEGAEDPETGYLKEGPHWKYDFYPTSGSVPLTEYPNNSAFPLWFDVNRGTFNDANRITFNKTGPQEFEVGTKIWLPVRGFPWPVS